MCYEKNFLNYWLFEELRPADPENNETGRNAEGIFALPREKAIAYPGAHQLVRKDGNRLSLWSVPMQSLELQYDAVHLPCDTYFTDSGGGWQRSSDPLDHDLSNGRHQILIHPEYWRGSKKTYFFLSTARSGSLWLSEVLKKATPFEHDTNTSSTRTSTAERLPDKATANFRSLEDEPEAVQTRLAEAWEELDGQKRDYAEVERLPRVICNGTAAIFPEAVFIHLHRHPANVVRSLMERDWYDAPDDHAHPRLRKADAAALDRFERVCQYVAEVNERLQEVCDDNVALEELTQSPKQLADALKRLKIPYYPRLGDHLIDIVVNASKKRQFPSPDQWSLAQKMVFQKILGMAVHSLSYPLLVNIPCFSRAPVNFFLIGLKKLVRRWGWALIKLLHGRTKKITIDVTRLKGFNCAVSVEPDGIVIRPQANGRHAYLSLGGSDWNTVVKDRILAIGMAGRAMELCAGQP